MSTFVETMSQLQELEQTLQSMIADVVNQIREKVTSTPLEGVQLVSESPRVAIVKFSRLAKADNWSAEYHIPACQAAAVEHRLTGCKSAASLSSAVQDMLKTRRVKMGSGSNDYTYLNDTTIQILSDSELGKWVTKEQFKKGEKHE